MLHISINGLFEEDLLSERIENVTGLSVISLFVSRSAKNMLVLMPDFVLCYKEQVLLMKHCTVFDVVFLSCVTLLLTHLCRKLINFLF